MNRSIQRTAFAALLVAASVLPTVADAAPASSTMPSSAVHTRKVAILLYPGIEVLDFGGPLEVFADAAQFGAVGATPAFEVFTVAKTREPILSQGVLHVVPDYSIADCPQPDILILPGGGSASVTNDPEWMAWIKRTADGSQNVLTVCTGAFIAGKAGLLDGHDVTTFYNAVPALGKQFPAAHVMPGRRFIDNGKLVTTAGVSAGIDGSLHLVARLKGRYVADRVAEYMEYRWTPESYLATHYSTFDPELDAHGRELQMAQIEMREGDLEGAARSYRQMTRANAADADAWLGLGRTLHRLKRYDEAIVAHQQARKGEPQRALASYNLACEYALTGKKELAMTTLQAAVASGFRQRGTIEGDDDLAALHDDPRFKQLVAGL